MSIISAIVIIAQIIYLPIVAFTSTSAANTIGAVAVQPNTSTGYDPVFGHIIYGEVRNATPDPVALVRVTATRQNGQIADTITKIGTVNAGESGCFAIYTQSAEPWTDASLSVSSMPAYAPRAQLAINETQSGMDNGYPVVDATIRNTAGVTMSLITVISTLYDVGGNVIGCGDAIVTPRRVGIDKAGTASIRFSQWAKREVGGYVVAANGVAVRIPQ